MGYLKPLENIVFHVVNEHSDGMDTGPILAAMNKGKNLGLLSEAGSPCIADPGANIVQMAHRNNIKVIPLTGPSSIFMALMASGFNGQNFTFNGYLPVNKRERKNKIKILEREAYRNDSTQIFIETPYRNNALLEDILQTCRKETMLCIACNILTEKEFILSCSIGEWKKNIPDLHKKPTVFLIYQ